MTYMKHDEFELPNQVQELSFEEIDEVNGAFGPGILLAGAAVAILGIAVIAGVIDGVSGNESQTK